MDPMGNHPSSGWWYFKHVFFFHNKKGISLPIDELHHFSKWFFNHQPDNHPSSSITITILDQQFTSIYQTYPSDHP
jgi:hypothetical protein